MSDPKDFPIDLFEYLMWVSLAMSKSGEYISRSQSRRTGDSATADVAWTEMKAASTSAREDRRISKYTISEACCAYRWAYRLNKPKDILRRIAHAGEVQQVDLAHAASIISEYKKRHESSWNPNKMARILLANADFQFPMDPVFDLETGRESFEQALRMLIGPQILEPGGFRRGILRLKPIRLISVGVIEVDDFPTLLQAHGQAAGTSILREIFQKIGEATKALAAKTSPNEFADLVDSPLAETPEVLAAARISHAAIAIATDFVLRRDLRDVIAGVIEEMTARPCQIGQEEVSIVLHAGVTDFFDCPASFPSPNHSATTKVPLFFKSLIALERAHQAGHNQVANCSSNSAPLTSVHPRTPEQTD
jgi:GGDEF domain-containing protein